MASQHLVEGSGSAIYCASTPALSSSHRQAIVFPSFTRQFPWPSSRSSKFRIRGQGKKSGALGPLRPLCSPHLAALNELFKVSVQSSFKAKDDGSSRPLPNSPHLLFSLNKNSPTAEAAMTTDECGLTLVHR